MLHTRICDMLGIEHPIISAPMSGGTAAADLAAAVSEAERILRERPGQVLK